MANGNQIKLFEVDAFTTRPGHGNRAGVVFQGDVALSEAQMSRIAVAAGHSETAFVTIGQPGRDLLDKPLSSAAKIATSVRFFTKGGFEVPMCGHATIALNHVLAQTQFAGSANSTFEVIQSTAAGLVELRLSKDGEVVMDLGSIVIGEKLPDELLRQALSVAKPASPIPTRAVGSPGNRFILVDIDSIGAVNKLNPNIEQIRELSLKHNAIGVMAYAVRALKSSAERRHLVVSRVFVPAVGIAEDPVTGMANAALAAYLHSIESFTTEDEAKSRFFAVQGIPGSRGSMSISVAGVQSPRVTISGSAVTVVSRDIAAA